MLEVHRARPGDELVVGLVNDRTGIGTVTALDASALCMDVRFDRDPPAALPVTLVLALPRPKVLRRVIHSATSLGVKRLVLLNAFRVEKSYWSSPVLAPEALLQEMVAGLEQAKDTVLPEVLLRPLFKPFVEDELPGMSQDSLRLVAHPGADSAFPRELAGRVTLAVGPEGGFIPYELGKLSNSGFSQVHFGTRILSVETAVTALLTRLMP